MTEFKALGTRVVAGAFVEHLETFMMPPNCTQVEMASDEVTAVCPVTGQPDWYTVQISYIPLSKCLESKSLKLYLQSFRNEGIFCENFASRIADDLFNILEPAGVQVTVTQKPRGGVMISATAGRRRHD